MWTIYQVFQRLWWYTTVTIKGQEQHKKQEQEQEQEEELLTVNMKGNSKQTRWANDCYDQLIITKQWNADWQICAVVINQSVSQSVRQLNSRCINSDTQTHGYICRRRIEETDDTGQHVQTKIFKMNEHINHFALHFLSYLLLLLNSHDLPRIL